MDDTDGEALLETLRQERGGYTLSYHEIYARLEPGVLDAYGALYRRLTLTPRFMPNHDREVVWVALLAAIDEEVGSIHVDRAEAAGVTPAELSAAVALAAVADTWPTLAFAYGWWGERLDGELPGAYQRMVDGAAGPLEPWLVELTLAVVQGAKQRADPLLAHLRHVYDHGVDEHVTGEAFSYLLQPIGANGFLWATDRWLDGIRSGALPTTERFAGVNFDTRRS